MDELIIYDEIFVERIYDLNETPFVPDTVVDCGGFEGHFTLLARARFPQARFVVFEPHPINFEAMCANFERNGVSVDARREAVSAQAGEGRFTGGGANGHLTAGAESPGGPVKVADLRELIRDMAPRRLLLKLDVEGEEMAIIPGLLPSLPRMSAIYFEWHHGSESLGRIEATLRAAGFAVNRCRSRSDDMYVDVCACRQ
jgi:FkbM family methyltransferase